MQRGLGSGSAGAPASLVSELNRRVLLPRVLPPERQVAPPHGAKRGGYWAFEEADARTRTGDPFITSEVLYQLSYVGGARQCSAAQGADSPLRAGTE